ncbi:MAG: diguanylate cyclase [Gemmataceae bacterium]
MLRRRYPLATDPVVIGRGDDADIQINNNSVSRRHAKIEPTTDGYFVVDLQSTNGTFVGDFQVSTPQRLRDGDYIRIGNCIFKFLSGEHIEADYHEEIYRLTIFDGLTNIHNQRYLVDFLERELARSLRHNRPLSVLMIDIDRFKLINDEHGHICGDFILREMCLRLRGQIRREDLFARYGGEEFCQVLVETELAEAIEFAERMRSVVASVPFHFETHDIPVTISVGVASTCGQGESLNPKQLLKRADEQLYNAKNSGRNRVCS